MKPYSYQLDGISFLQEKKRAILADDPGVGKTVQALKALDPPALVVVPGFAMGVWRREIGTWRPDLSYIIYRGTPKQRQEMVENTEADIVICTYAMMSEIQQTISSKWQTLIFDESHILRNRGAKTLYPIARKFKSERLYLLTGTPVVNGAQDIWTSLNMIDRKRFSSYWKFVEHFAIVYENLWAEAKIVEGTNPITAPQLQELLKHYMLRRTAEQVGLELPDKTRQSVPVDMTPRQYRAYDQMLKDLILEIDHDPGILLSPNTLSQMTRLRQLLVCPEILGIDDRGGAILSLASETESLTQPIVVFTPFADAIPFIVDELESQGRPARKIQGGMNPDTISDNLEWFSKGGQKALVSTIQMAAAWSATAARIAYFVGFTFSTHEHTQAEARLHRHGQNWPTLMKYLVHENTIDDHVLDILSRKTTWQRLAVDPSKLLTGS